MEQLHWSPFRRAAVLLAFVASTALAQEAPPPPSDTIYQEGFRPQFHYSPPFGWMNDPNGMVFYKGEYHLFFQFNPFATEFGDIGWGHAISRDLVHWQQLPVAIQPAGETEIFTGSVVIDSFNTSGLCQSPDPGDPSCLIAIYTANLPSPGGETSFDQVQELAYSNDQGRTWIKYDGNPVLDVGDPSFRDPKVFWYAPQQKWVMAITLPAQRLVRFYDSADLKEWDRLGEFGGAGSTAGDWECPDLLQVPVDGDPDDTRWVLKVDVKQGDVVGGSGAQYFIGDFDGTTFVNANPADQVLWTDYGKDEYCTHRFYDAPNQFGDPIWIAWMSDWQYAEDLPTYPWKGQMTLARSVALESRPEGLRLTQQPVASVELLRGAEVTVEGTDLAAINDRLSADDVSPEVFELILTLRPGAAREAGVRLRLPPDGDTPGPVVATVGYDAASQQLFIDRPAAGNLNVAPEFPGLHRGPLALREGQVEIRLFVDRSSIEAFGNQGERTITDLIYPKEPGQILEGYAEGGGPELFRVQYWPLRSVWFPPEASSTEPPSEVSAALASGAAPAGQGGACGPSAVGR